MRKLSSSLLDSFVISLILPMQGEISQMLSLLICFFIDLRCWECRFCSDSSFGLRLTSCCWVWSSRGAGWGGLIRLSKLKMLTDWLTWRTSSCSSWSTRSLSYWSFWVGLKKFRSMLDLWSWHLNFVVCFASCWSKNLRTASWSNWLFREVSSCWGTESWGTIGMFEIGMAKSIFSDHPADTSIPANVIWWCADHMHPGDHISS